MGLDGQGAIVRFNIRQQTATISGIFFNANEEFIQLPSPCEIDIAYHIELKKWQGMLGVGVRLRDWRLSE